MASFEDSFQTDLSQTSTLLGDQYSQPQQLKFIEDQLKELEQKIQHIDQIVKQKITLIQHSQRLKVLVQSIMECVPETLLGNFTYNQEFECMNLTLDQDPTKPVSWSIELKEQDYLHVSDISPTWQKVGIIEQKIKQAEEQIDSLDRERNWCQNQRQNLRHNHEQIYRSYFFSFQVDIKNIR